MSSVVNSVAKSALAILVSFAALGAHADETPVFVSCYPADGSNLLIQFDTAQSTLIYRLEKDSHVDTFTSSPSPAGRAKSSVTADFSADREHVILKAQIIGGDAFKPVVEASAFMQFDHSDAGWKATSPTLLHLGQKIDLSGILPAGTCYVQ